jgi:hypothetical protein
MKQQRFKWLVNNASRIDKCWVFHHGRMANAEDIFTSEPEEANALACRLFQMAERKDRALPRHQIAGSANKEAEMQGKEAENI